MITECLHFPCPPPPPFSSRYLDNVGQYRITLPRTPKYRVAVLCAALCALHGHAMVYYYYVYYYYCCILLLLLYTIILLYTMITVVYYYAIVYYYLLLCTSLCIVL